LVVGAEESGAFETCPGKGLEPDAIAQPMDDGEHPEGPYSEWFGGDGEVYSYGCLLYTSPSPRD